VCGQQLTKNDKKIKIVETGKSRNVKKLYFLNINFKLKLGEKVRAMCHTIHFLPKCEVKKSERKLPNTGMIKKPAFCCV